MNKRRLILYCQFALLGWLALCLLRELVIFPLTVIGFCIKPDWDSPSVLLGELAGNLLILALFLWLLRLVIRKVGDQRKRRIHGGNLMTEEVTTDEDPKQSDRCGTDRRHSREE